MTQLTMEKDSLIAHQQAVIAQLQARLKDVNEGLNIVDRQLAKILADPAEAPFPLVEREAQIWRDSSVGAYQHALEMCNASSLKAFVENGFSPVKDE